MSNLIEHVEASLVKTNNYESKVDNYILQLDGMSGKKTRHFYNNICSLPNARYLEIGVWKGSTTCAAMCGNQITCVAIDNWSEFDGPKNEFINNFNKYIGANNARFIESDCWSIDATSLGTFNIYMYDGNHAETSHFMALNHYLPALDNEFIYIIDDWNWKNVRDGTLNSISKNNLNILYQKEIFTTHDNSHPSHWGPGGAGKLGDWHNGICIFVLQK
jgi:hypothetical protein